MFVFLTLALTQEPRWTPGIGDPTVLGWVSVVAYFVAAWLCQRASRKRLDPASELPTHRLVRFWLALALIMCVLGINKQLDLQSLLTQVGRDLAIAQGWYQDRRSVQLWFVGIVLAIALAAFGGILFWAWPFRRYIWVPSLGMGLLLAFVLIRASSFHHMDVLIGLPVLGVKMNAILGLGSIAVITLGARRYISI